MGRSLRLLLATVVAGALSAGVCFAGIPDPALSDVPNVVTSPDGNLEYIVTVVGADGPIDSALVEIVFSTETDGLVCWCVGQVHPTIQANSNALGQASFFISGGGCVDPALVTTPPAVEVFANGIKLGEPGVVSSDVVDDGGRKPTDVGYAPGGACKVVIADAVYFTGPIVSGTYDYCTDMDSSGVVNIADAVIVTGPIVSGAICTEAP